MAQGTSRKINIPGQSMQCREIPPFTLSKSQYEGLAKITKPPEPNSDGSTPQTMFNMTNIYRDFAFAKLCPPLYGQSTCVARYTGIPANQPDFISAANFIPLMRLIDDMLQHRHKGHLNISGSNGTGTK